LGILPFVYITNDDYYGMIHYLLQEFRYQKEEEGRDIGKRCYAIFSKFNIHERCHTNAILMLTYYMENLDQFKEFLSHHELPIYLTEMVCLQAKPTADCIEVFTQYVLLKSYHATIRLCTHI
jgi:hypothetical protein